MLNQTETLRLIRCDIADETYGLDMFWVRSIQRTDRLHRNPEIEPSEHSPMGWLPDEKGDIPVFSLARKLGRPSKEGGTMQRIVVLNTRPRPWALLVDRVSQVIQIPADRVVPLPPIVVNPAADYFEGVIKLDEQLILFLSPERLRPDASPPSLSSPPLTEGSREGAREAASPSPGPSTESPKASAGGRRRGHGRIVVFSITEPHPTERALSFGLSISQVPEILKPLPMIPVPAAPAFVLGLVNWRDRPVPVIDLVSRLGVALEANPSAKGRTRLVVARDKSHTPLVPSPVAGSPAEGAVEGSTKGEANQGALVGFPVRLAIRMLRLPVVHQPCHRTLPLDQTLARGVVELENETLVIPDIRGILWRGGSDKQLE